MGCLFGYAGVRSDGLLERMAGILRHRCAGGWERVSMNSGDVFAAAIGRGIAPWSNGSQVSVQSDKPDLIVGVGGALFKRLSFSLRPDYEPYQRETFVRQQIQQATGAFVSAHAFDNTLILNRDPSGIKVLYWTMTSERLLFSSEIKALFADSGTPRRLRLGALPEYLTFSYIPGQRTMFEDIYELQPGTMLIYRNGQVSIERYFEFEQHEWQHGDSQDESEFAERVRMDLEQGIKAASSIGKNPPAVFVSGGIDSSAVLAVLAQIMPDVRLKTFSIHFGKNYANENQFVSLMTERYHTDHTYLEISPKHFLKNLRQIIWYLDDPIGDPITAPNFMMAQAASAVTSTALNGEGGDPCFGGPKNIPMFLSQIYGPNPADPDNGWLERRYLQSYRKCYDDLESLLNPDVLKESGGIEALSEVVRPFFKADKPRHFLNKLMAANIRLKGANLILAKVDKMTSANGILVLAPLFFQNIITTSMACHPKLKLHGNIEKYILKRAVENIVPLPIIERPKTGMMVPVRFWLRDEMKRYAAQVLSPKRLKDLPYFYAPYIKRLLKYDQREVHSARYGLKLWMLITFMLWHEQMIELK